MKWLDILKVIGPAVMAVVPGAQPFIPLVVAGIEVAESSGKDGASKRVLAKEAVRFGAQAANTIAKRDVVPVDQAEAVFDSTVDTIVGVVNIVKANTDAATATN